MSQEIQMPTDYQRRMRRQNIAANGCVEEDCPACKGSGLVRQANTRIAGTAMKAHLAAKHDAQICGCPRSTVSQTRKCVRCGGFGTIPVRLLAREDDPKKTRKRAAKK